jgi:fructose-1,6-bisphosphatase
MINGHICWYANDSGWKLCLWGLIRVPAEIRTEHLQNMSLGIALLLFSTFVIHYSRYSRLSIIRAWFNRFAAQPRQCVFKEKILFSVSITFV